MTVIDRTGDIFTTELPVIGHGVNTVGVMGAGIAKTVRTLYPSVYNRYRALCDAGNFPGGVCIVYGAEEWEGEGQRYIANISSQITPGSNATLELLAPGLEMAMDRVSNAGLPGIALPRIGAGIGGLDWDEARRVIEAEAERHPELTVEIWTYEP